MLRRCTATRFKAAVLLSGCGVYDGSEITEAVSCIVHLYRVGATTVKCFAPDALQHHVINHAVGGPAPNEQRSCAQEAARIFRGPVGEMKDCTPAQHDCLVLPGGFGVMKNLSNFAFDGAAGAIRPDVAWAIEEFHKSGKPIGAVCIAPMLLARCLSRLDGVKTAPLGTPLKLTMGSTKGDAAAMASSFGATLVEAGVREAVADRARRVVTTPAYMIEGVNQHDVFVGVGHMMDALATLVKEA